MDFKEYLLIINKKRKLFYWVIILTVFSVGVYFYFQPPYYDVLLTMDITRLGKQTTQDYRYDDFYRLQADEKFAETVVKWATNPRMIKDIYSEAGIKTQKFGLTQRYQKFSAQKESSQIVTINFKAPNKLIAKKVAFNLSKGLSYNTQELNKDQHEANWFKLIFKKPVIIKHSFNYLLIFVVTVSIGIFLGFWVVMLKYYFE